MPFVTQTDTRMHQSPTRVGKIFSGRVNEQQFFLEHFLTPNIPTAHMIWVWGPTGVGKSTLLTFLRDKAYRSGLRGTCLTALLDERLFTPADLMEHCAAQLRLAGAPLATFEQALTRYRQTVPQQQSEQAFARAAFLREVDAQVRSKVMGESLLGGWYATMAREASASFWSERFPFFLPTGEVGHLEDALGELTRAFVNDLNWLTTARAPFHLRRTTRGCRVILFFDTSEPAVTETIGDWLLHHVLPSTISDQIVLVVAGREAIKQALPDEQLVYSMLLTPFTERETRAYLAKCGITAKDRVAAIWHLSDGLPLSVSMLACDQARHLDVTTDVAANALCWLAGQDHRAQWLVLQAALCSRPFTQDDLAAFHTLAEQERTDFYRWLIDLPFVQLSSLDGRHRFHPLARQWFVRAFFQRAPYEEQATRRALAHSYWQQMERGQARGGKDISSSAEWLELALARVSQLLCLPDAGSQSLAVEQALVICHKAQQQRALAQLLRALSREQPPGHEYAEGRHTAHLLLHYIEADLASQELLTAATNLLEAVHTAPAFPPSLLAQISGKCAMAYYSRSDYQQAIQNLDQALALDPAYTGAYLLRGIAYSACKEYQRAIADFDRALALDAKATFAYAHRGIIQWECKDYQQAVADFDRALALDPRLEGALLLRHLASWEFLSYRPGREDVDGAIALNPSDALVYVLRGIACCSLNEKRQAIADFDRALIFNPSDALAYAGRGHVYLEMGEIERARTNFLRSQALAPHDVYVGLLLEWLGLCQQESPPDRPDFSERLEGLAARDPQQPVALVCRGMSLLLRGRFEEAEASLDRVLLLNPGMREALFWKSLVCAELRQDEEARAALARVLLTPLCWLEQKRPDFYRNYVEPLLVCAKERQKQCT